MKFFKFIITAIIVFSCFFTISYAEDLNEEIAPIPVNSDTTDLNFEIFSKRAIVYERNSKCILFEKNIDEQCAMASTTKIMTCTLILENCNLQDQVTISQKSASTGGSRLGLSTNDTISVQDLLYGLMLCSGNDAAVALAEHCSGSIENFANLMNAKAQELSLSSTHFVTPHGLDNPEHYTTVRNFAFLTDYALNNPLFLQIVGTKYYDVFINGVPKSIHNTKTVLYIYVSFATIIRQHLLGNLNVELNLLSPTALENIYPSELPTIMKSFFLCYGDETPGSVEPSGEHGSCFGGGSSECSAQGNLE